MRRERLVGTSAAIWLRLQVRCDLEVADRDVRDSAGDSDGVTDGRPGATSLIQGKMKDIMAFLDRLSYGEAIPPEIARTREEWRRKWRENDWSSSKGQGS